MPSALRTACAALLAASVWLVGPGCDRTPPSTEAPLVQKALADPLPSWNQGKARQAILDFVARVTQAGGAEYVPPDARIAVFDNDGTLWAEKPVPFQVMFAFDQVRSQGSRHP